MIPNSTFRRRSLGADTVGLVSPKRTKTNTRGLGRPPLPEGVERASVNLTIRLKPSERVAYEAAAVAAGVSLGDWIRAACEARLPRRKKA